MKYLVFIIALIFLSGCVKQPEVRKEKVVEKETSCKECIKSVPCPVCEACAKISPCKKCKDKVVYKGYEKIVIGEIEEVHFSALDLSLDARIDTGATTTSLDAKNIVPFERDGKKWVRFEVLKKDKSFVKVKRPLVRKITVKRHGKEGQERYVVKMRLTIASISNFTEVSLTDRSQYKFPVLIGRNFLKGNMLVDVSLKHTKSPRKEKK